jgi:hypothetical protein
MEMCIGKEIINRNFLVEKQDSKKDATIIRACSADSNTGIKLPDDINIIAIDVGKYVGELYQKTSIQNAVSLLRSLFMFVETPDLCENIVYKKISKM